MANIKVMESSKALMDNVTRDIELKENLMEKEYLNGQVDLFMRVNLLTTRYKVMESISGMMEEFIKDNIIKTSNMEKVHIIGQMEMFMRASFLKE